VIDSIYRESSVSDAHKELFLGTCPIMRLSRNLLISPFKSINRLGQVPGTSDASKTQLALTRWDFLLHSPAFPSKTEVCQNLVGPISTRRFAENEGVANIFVSSELGSEAW
jgi:hypothetical protein